MQRRQERAGCHDRAVSQGPDQPDHGGAEDQVLALDLVRRDNHDPRPHRVPDRTDRQVQD